MPPRFKSVLVTGGGGYVGSALVPALLRQGYRVRVVDVFWYGRDVFEDCQNHPALEIVELDIRDTASLAANFKGMEAVLHLACVSNDPSYELNPDLAKTINFDCFPGLLQGAIDAGVKRFVYASSSSIYGVKAEPNVKEDAEPLPLTDYSRYKLECERLLLEHANVGGMERVIIRPATVCGYAPRLRLDLVVNTLTIHALVNRRIRVFGGTQLRPNIGVRDMVRAYQTLLEADAVLIDGEAFNVGTQNHTVKELAEMIRATLGDTGVAIDFEPSHDNRSYHINSDKIRERLGFAPRDPITVAIRDLADAYRAGKMHDPLTNPIYYNIRTMQRL